MLTMKDLIAVEKAKTAVIKAASAWRENPDSDRLTIKLIEAVDLYEDTLYARTHRADNDSKTD